MQIVVVFALLGLATILLVTERLRPDIVAMLVLAALVVTRILDPSRALSGFSNPATVVVACMFVLSAGLQSSGVVEFLGDRLLRHGPAGPVAMLALTALVIGPASAFINNTAAVAVFLPVILRASEARRISPSRLMMPLSFFAMLGGTCTLIGTSTNIVVSSIAADAGLRPFGMFEFSLLGIILFVAGSLYLFTVGQRAMPERVPAGSKAQGFNINRYLSELRVGKGSRLIGKTLEQAALAEKHDVEILAQVRDGVVREVPEGHSVIREGDRLLVRAEAASLVKLREREGLAPRAERNRESLDLESGGSALVELVVKPDSEVEYRTLKGIDFRRRFGATVLAIRHYGRELRERIALTPLRGGDELLVLVPRNGLQRLREEPSFVLLGELEIPVVRPRRALIAGLLIAGVVGFATFGPFSIVETAVVGAALMVLTGCLPARKVYETIDWRVIFLLAGLLPLGIAFETTGAAKVAVDFLLQFSRELGPTVVLGCLFFTASVLTGFMSNTATAALLAPLAIATADTLGLNPRPFLMAVTFAASAAFFTPIGYQTNLLVDGPGGYRFNDYVKVGGPLTLLYALLATLLIPIFFPF